MLRETRPARRSSPLAPRDPRAAGTSTVCSSTRRRRGYRSSTLRVGLDSCDVIAAEAPYAESTEVSRLGLDHLVRFSLRGPASGFEDALAADPTVDPATLDTGLRIAMHIKNTEYVGLRVAGPVAAA